ncbi:MAG: hypothetical protein ACFFC7_09800 [Candidatus Hermodarchaeota archaeon]
MSRRDLKTDIKNKGYSRSFSISLLIFSVIIGLVINWVAFYLSIVLGFLSIGISTLVILLLAKLVYRKRELTAKDLALINIAYRGTFAAEASTGLLFLIWLFFNAESFLGVPFSPPSWLLPSSEVLSQRIIFTTEWVVPLLIHWFLMLIPGVLGIVLGWKIAPYFITNEKEYKFPGIIQTKVQIDVVAKNDTEKRKIFIQWAVIGFIFALLSTLFLPFIDFSTNQIILGTSLGVVGLAMFSIGFIIRQPKMTVLPILTGVIFYCLLSYFLLPVSFSLGESYVQTFNAILSTLYLSFMIGAILGGFFLGGIVRSLIKRLIERKKQSCETEIATIETKNDKKEVITNDTEENLEASQSQSYREIFEGLLRRHKIILVSSIVFYAIAVFFVIQLEILPISPIFIFLALFWVLIVGNLVNGFIVTQSVAKSSVAAVPPFIFDFLPLYVVGARGYVPYIATPRSETGEVISIVNTQKLAQVFGIHRFDSLLVYFAGYLASILTTPIFALFLWYGLGIGTAQLPAPAFPVSASMIGIFITNNPLDVFKIDQALVGILLTIILGPNFSLGLIFGLIFPIHMLIPLALGGLVRFILDKKKDPNVVADKGNLIVTALSAGGSIAIFPIILFAIL